MAKASWGSRGWGRWHTGPEAGIDCPQDGRRHTADEAIALNEKDREYAQAKAWQRHKEWIGGVRSDNAALRPALLEDEVRGDQTLSPRQEASLPSARVQE